LLGNPQVQKELKMTEEQTAKVGEIMQALMPQRGQGGANFQNMTDEERQAFFEEMRKKTEEAGKKATALLTDEQNARLKQIQLWMAGSRALNDPEVAKKLNLTDEQKDAVKTISEESGKKMGELFQGMRGANEEERAKIQSEVQEVRKAADEECLAVLTDA